MQHEGPCVHFSCWGSQTSRAGVVLGYKELDQKDLSFWQTLIPAPAIEQENRNVPTMGQSNGHPNPAKNVVHIPGLRAAD
jgi:hypothetical protein